LVTATSQQLAAIDGQLVTARQQMASLRASLQRVAVDDYTNDGLVTSNSHLQLFAPTDSQGEFAQYLGTVAVASLANGYNEAQQQVRTAASERDAALSSVTQASATLAAAITLQNQALTQLETDAAAIEVARSCVPPPVVTTADTPSPATSGPAASSTPSASKPNATPSAAQPAGPPAPAGSPQAASGLTTTTSPLSGSSAPGSPDSTSSGAQPAPSVTAGALWTQLQTCLAPSPPTGLAPTRS
jgi:hypothetical protein